MKIAINGLGRIGRSFLRAFMADVQAQKKIDIVAINIGPARRDFVAHMLKYDTLMGQYPGTVAVEGDTLVIDNKRIALLTECDPAATPWGKLGIDWVVDCSGCFTKRAGAQQHIDAGAKRVLISAPAQDEDIAIVPGVNHDAFDPAKHTIVSLGSCTTNAFIPMLQVLHNAFGIQSGFMTTIHAYTNTQVLIDVEDKDLRRSRAAALNIIPTTTGASKMLGKVLPELAGKVPAVAVRVPVAKGSLIDLTFVAKQELTIPAIHQAVQNATQGYLQGIMDITMEPLVSADFNGSPYSVTIDGLLTDAHGTTGKLFGWYDNEWGYSMRLKDFLVHVA